MGDDLLTPNAELAEKSVISAMLQDTRAVWDVVEVLPPNRLIQPKHEIIYEAILRLANEKAPTDQVAVISELERTGDLERAGGPAYITELALYAPTWINAGFYADVVRRESVKWRLRSASAKVLELSRITEGSEGEIIEAARRAVDDAVDVPEISIDQAPRDGLWEMVEGIGEATPAHPTPWMGLSSMIRGFRPGGLYIMAARPALGKSALALQIATELEHYGMVGYFTLEMSAAEVRRRQLSQVKEIPLQFIEGDKRLDGWMADAAQDFAATHPAHILFDDRGLITINDIRQKVRTWNRHYNLSGIVVDYLQLMGGTSPSMTRLEAVTEVSRGLKVLARDMNVPVIALSQLNRNPESRADKMPALSDLRESGAIEQDADVVLLLHRDMGYTDFADDNTLQIIVAKNRQGPTGRIDLRWEGGYVSAL